MVFDENQHYDPSEPDLTQLVAEPMIETTFETPQHYRAIVSSLELEDDEISVTDVDATEDVSSLVAEGERLTKKGVTSSNDFTLPTPLPTPQSALESTPESMSDLTLASTSNYVTPRTSPPVTLTEERLPKANTVQPKHVVSASLDVGNILPEGVTRSRKKKYAAALQTTLDGKLTAFHNAFFAFSTAIKYYDVPPRSTFLPSPITPIKLHRDSLPPEPQNFRELAKHPFAEGFKHAMRVELTALRSKTTWAEVPKDEAEKEKRTPIPTTWVFKYKFDDQGFLIKYKARLCARGDLQKTEGDTYAATLAARIFRALMALAAAFDLETRQYDAVNAFANSPINEPTYCTLPQGWDGLDINILLKLLRALYGLRQSPALWYQNLSKTFLQLGLDPVPGVECCFVNDHMIVFFFVDDISVLYDKRYTKEVDEFQSRLFEIYEMRNLGEIEWFIGVRVIRDRPHRLLWLCQDSYIDKLASKFNISSDTRHYNTPLPVKALQKNTGQATAQEIYAYQQRVGSINFAAVITRLDVAHAASKLSEHLTNPSSRHLELANRTIDYLVGTRSLAIQFNGLSDQSKSIFLASSDASFADDPDTRYSSQGYVFTLFDGPIDWKANKQKTVTLSSTEAELLTMSTTGKETIWWTRFFDAIDFDPGHKTFIQCDNRQTIRAFNSDHPRFTTKLRHVDIHRHWLRQEVSNGTLDIRWTPTATILADGLTKPLTIQRHRDFVRSLGMKDVKDKTEKGESPTVGKENPEVFHDSQIGDS